MFAPLLARPEVPPHPSSLVRLVGVELAKVRTTPAGPGTGGPRPPSQPSSPTATTCAGRVIQTFDRP